MLICKERGSMVVNKLKLMAILGMALGLSEAECSDLAASAGDPLNSRRQLFSPGGNSVARSVALSRSSVVAEGLTYGKLAPGITKVFDVLFREQPDYEDFKNKFEGIVRMRGVGAAHLFVDVGVCYTCAALRRNDPAEINRRVAGFVYGLLIFGPAESGWQRSFADMMGAGQNVNQFFAEAKANPLAIAESPLFAKLRGLFAGEDGVLASYAMQRNAEKERGDARADTLDLFDAKFAQVVSDCLVRDNSELQQKNSALLAELDARQKAEVALQRERDAELQRARTAAEEQAAQLAKLQREKAALEAQRAEMEQERATSREIAAQLAKLQREKATLETQRSELKRQGTAVVEGNFSPPGRAGNGDASTGGFFSQCLIA